MRHQKTMTFAFAKGRPVQIDDRNGAETGTDAAGKRVEVPPHIFLSLVQAGQMEPAVIQEICDGNGMEKIKEYVAQGDKWAVWAKEGSAKLKYHALLSMLGQARAMDREEADFLSLLMILFAKSGVVTCEGRDDSIAPDPVAAAFFVFPTIRAIAAKAKEAQMMESLVREGLLSLMSESVKPIEKREYTSLPRHLCIQNAMRPNSPGPKDKAEEDLLRDCVEKQCAEDDPEAIEYKAEALMDGHGIFKKDLKEAERCFRQLIAISVDEHVTARFYWRLSRLYSMRGMKDDAESWKCLSAAMVGRDGFALCDFAERFKNANSGSVLNGLRLESVLRAFRDGLEDYAAGRYNNNLAGAALLISKDWEERAKGKGLADTAGCRREAFGYALLCNWALRLRHDNSPSPEDAKLFPEAKRQMLSCRRKSGLLKQQDEALLKAGDFGKYLFMALNSQDGRSMTATFIQKEGASSWLSLRWKRSVDEEAAPAVITFCPEIWYAGAQPAVLLEATTGKLLPSGSDEAPVVEFDEVRGADLFLHGCKTGTIEGDFLITDFGVDNLIEQNDEGTSGGGEGSDDGGKGVEGDAGPEDGEPFSMPSEDILQ